MVAEEDHEIIDKCRQVQAAENYLDFMQYCWQTNSPFIVGHHTRIVAGKLDHALERLQDGESTYIIMTIPFRHGKSDLASRFFPPYVFGRFPDLEVILATYNQPLSNNMSRDARAIMKSEEYQRVFDSRLAADSAAVEQWGIQDHRGKLQAVGIEGGATGKGADVLIIDDYLKGRKDAESEQIRASHWDNFSGNFMTRLAPAHIVVILATPWHVDDIIGRIKNRMDPEHEDFKEDFPEFELIKFPARSEQYPSGYLFPERFSEDWYKTEFAVLGEYQSAGLLQCEPTMRGGNMLNIENVQIHDSFPDDLLWVRYWDLASTEKERVKDNPDFTAGAKVAVKEIDGLKHLYIDDVRTCQQEATARDQLIISTAEDDGQATWQGVESVAGYKDAYTNLKKILKGKAVVYKGTVSGDKVVRAGYIEPIFEAGNVHIKKAYWNKNALKELGEFPSGVHDDIVDAVSGGYQLAVERFKKSKQLGGNRGKGAR